MQAALPALPGRWPRTLVAAGEPTDGIAATPEQEARLHAGSVSPTATWIEIEVGAALGRHVKPAREGTRRQSFAHTPQVPDGPALLPHVESTSFGFFSSEYRSVFGGKSPVPGPVPVTLESLRTTFLRARMPTSPLFVITTSLALTLPASDETPKRPLPSTFAPWISTRSPPSPKMPFPLAVTATAFRLCALSPWAAFPVAVTSVAFIRSAKAPGPALSRRMTLVSVALPFTTATPIPQSWTSIPVEPPSMTRLAPSTPTQAPTALSISPGPSIRAEPDASTTRPPAVGPLRWWPFNRRVASCPSWTAAANEPAPHARSVRTSPIAPAGTCWPQKVTSLAAAPPAETKTTSRTARFRVMQYTPSSEYTRAAWQAMKFVERRLQGRAATTAGAAARSPQRQGVRRRDRAAGLVAAHRKRSHG